MFEVLYNEKIYSVYEIEQNEELKNKIIEASEKRNLYCKYCRKQVIYKRGKKNRYHFSHLQATWECFYSHLTFNSLNIKPAKQLLADYFKQLGYIVETDVKLTKIKADIVIYSNDGWDKLAVKLCKNISKDHFENINKDYQNHNIPLQWIILENNIDYWYDYRIIDKYYPKTNSLTNIIILHKVNNGDLEFRQFGKVEFEKNDVNFYYDNSVELHAGIEELVIVNNQITLKNFEYQKEIKLKDLNSRYKEHLEFKKKYNFKK